MIGGVTNWRILSFQILFWIELFGFGLWKRIVLLSGGVRRGTDWRFVRFIYSSSSRLCLVDVGLALRAVSGRYDSES